MKIVHVISSFGPGGAELLVKDIAINTNRDMKVEIWAVGEGEDKNFEERYLFELSRHNISYAKIGKKAGSGRLKVISAIRAYIKTRKPDIINTHSELSTFYVSLAAIGCKVKLVQTIHNTVVTYPFLQRYMARIFVRKYIAISEKCRLLIRNIIRPADEKIELIYNGINIRKFQQQKRTISSEVCNILVIGRLDVQKDHNTLLHAFAILKQRLEKENKEVPRLNIAGSGPLKEELIKTAQRLKLTDEVNFLGARNDVPELLYKNDLWVMSSRWEGLSIALLEAMASGIPIVATGVGSNDELIDNNINGRLVEKENPEQLAEGIYGLMQDAGLRKLFSDNSMLKVVNFNIRECAHNYSNLYYSLIENKGGLLTLSGVNK